MMNDKCPICSMENAIEYLYKNSIGNKSIVKCKNCEIEYLYPYPTQKELEEIYSDDYAAWGIGKEDSFSKMKKDKFKKLLKDVLKYKKNGKLLDIGCGPGYLMEEAEKLGFDVYGIEVGEKAADIAKNKFGNEKIYNGIIEKSNFKNNYFDIIMMSDVLEHVVNPLDLLKKSKELLISCGGGGVYNDYNS
ncbi:class I SAM-dependent methyltransferase [Brachyspira pilosicoli]